MTEGQTSEERTAVLMRIPRGLLERVDEFAKRTTPDNRTTSRHAALLTLLERGLVDKTRERNPRRKAAR